MTSDETITVAHSALQRGDLANSERLYRIILQTEPESICALDGLGILLCQKGETEQGIALFEKALSILRQEAPENAFPNIRWESSLLFHLGLSYRTLGQVQKALQVFTEAAKLAPYEFDLLLNLGQIHFELAQYAPAAAVFRTLASIQPDNASVWFTLGFILSNLARYDEAAEVLRTAEVLDSASPEVKLYLAEALRKAEQYESSLRPYRELLQVGTEYPQAVHGYGKSLLALGRLEQGWDAMEFRFISAFGTWGRHDLLNWTPDSKANHVLAYSEEGIGADLMFASCLPDLIDSAKHCVVECESSLHALFQRSFPRADFVPLADSDVSAEGNPWGVPLDAQIAFGSLPRYFRRNIEDFPLRKSYLVPDRDLVSQWSNRLHKLGDARKIGILWKGTWTNETAMQTSLPLQELRALINRHPGAAWISLQHGSPQNDMNQYRGSGVSPHIFPEAFRYDLDIMAALISSLDLVITPPGYISHLAGALGVRTWLLVPECADWRHTIDTISLTRSVWHPAIKMYRQAKGQTWQHFFTSLENDLVKFLTNYRPPVEMPVTLALPGRRTMAIPKSA